MAPPLKVFCCYAREDQDLLKALVTHLMPLQNEKLITIWSDIDLNAGDVWEEKLHRQLEEADIILLLISPDFLSSEYCYSTEMTRALERHTKEKSASVIPILLRPALWQHAPFAHLHVIPTGARPATHWSDRDAAFQDIVQHIYRLVTGKNAPFAVESLSSHTETMAPQRLETHWKSSRSPWLNRWSAIALCFILVLALSVGALLVTRGPLTTAHTPTVTATPPLREISPNPSPTSLPSPTSSVPTLSLPSRPPLVNDPMSQPDPSTQWDVSNNTYLSCGFVQGVYQLRAPAKQGGGCGTNTQQTIVQDFICEMQMTIIKGIDSQTSGAGIIFRFDTKTLDGYALSFRQDGSYLLYYSTGGLQTIDGLQAGMSTTFHTGVNQTNLIAIQMVGSTIEIFVNNSYLLTATDSHVAKGNIGVQLGSGTDEAIVNFSHLKMWTL